MEFRVVAALPLQGVKDPELFQGFRAPAMVKSFEQLPPPSQSERPQTTY